MEIIGKEFDSFYIDPMRKLTNVDVTNKTGGQMASPS